MITLGFSSISKVKKPLYVAFRTLFVKVTYYVVIMETLSKCLFLTTLIIQLKSLITQLKIFILLILKSSKLNLNIRKGQG